MLFDCSSIITKFSKFVREITPSIARISPKMREYAYYSIFFGVCKEKTRTGLYARAEDMDSAYSVKAIGGDRSSVRIVRMCRYEGNFAPKSDDDGRVIEIPRLVPKLYKITDFKPVEPTLLREGAIAVPHADSVADQEVVEIFHARPRRRAVVQGEVVPPQIGGEIHDAHACEQAL